MSSRSSLSIASNLFRATTPQAVRLSSITRLTPSRFTSSDTKVKVGKDEIKVEKPLEPEQRKKKTMEELDAELKLKMAELAGDGGEAGVELEDGQPVAMKRSVRNNMFRYI